MSHAAVERRLRSAERPDLVGALEELRLKRNEMIRKAVIEDERVDILATEVLGLTVEPFHLKMLQWSISHPDDLILVFRGAGKSTICTVALCIFFLICDRNLRIVLASKTKSNAEGFLKEIKAHLETNATLIEIFGAFYDPGKVGKWDNSEIEIVGRTIVAKEATITCVGLESAIVSKHYDIAMSDDLVDEDNSRTEKQREKTKTWYYQTLDPTLMPPDPRRKYVGRHHRRGTRYHPKDLWGHLYENELAKNTLRIPALDEHGRSPWPKKYKSSWFVEKRRKSGKAIFDAQYMCDTTALKGHIFQLDFMQFLPDEAWPKAADLILIIGVDPAVAAEEQNDKFALAVVGFKGDPFQGKDPEAVYIMDAFEESLRFPQQTPLVLDYYDEWEPVTIAYEGNAFQKAGAQQISKERPNCRITTFDTSEDKIVRAWKLAALMEQDKVFFHKDRSGDIIDKLLDFPNSGKDLFDAIDHAITTFRKRRRKKRAAEGGRREPGLL